VSCIREIGSVVRGIVPLWKLLTVAAALSCGGCIITPASGPGSLAIDVGLSDRGVQYGLVRITPDVIKLLSEYEPHGIAGTFPDKRPPPEIKFGIGDVVSVSIFEAAAGGLFIPIEAGVRPGNFVTLPNQAIDTGGNVSIPYAGPIRAAGRTPTQVQQAIVEAIRNRAIDPQAVVALATQNTSLISVLGEVNTPNRFPAQPAGERILDAITRAGGIKEQGNESWVVLERNGKRASVPFGAMIYDSANNIWVHPGDTIYVYREPQTFLAFGAAGQQGQFNFDQWRLTLAEAMAKAGGLLDIQADPASVYLYRREPRQLAEKLGVDCSKFEGPTVPVIYNVSFRDPAGYFLGTKLAMRNKDVVFAANAASVEIIKINALIATFVANAEGISATGNNIESWRIQSGIR
jgi:polysaccharide biosynthesis/export protein